jgi:quinol monooxygenase YgiN
LAIGSGTLNVGLGCWLALELATHRHQAHCGSIGMLSKMSEQISWCVALGVKPGQLDNFMKLTQEMVASTRNEPGVLSYQRFVGDDNKIVHAQERYVDSDAALMHLQNFAEKFAERFVSMVDRMRFTVYGTPTAELKELLDGFGAVYLSPFGDFEYWP